MSFSRAHAGILGLLFWIGLAVLGLATLWSSPAESTERSLDATGQLVAYAIQGPTRLPAVSPEGPLRPGDPIFYSAANTGWTQVGFIGRVDKQPPGRIVEIVWYHNEIAPQDCRFEAHHHRGTLGEVIQTLLPEEKREQIQERLSHLFEEHGEEIVQAFRPVVETSLRESAPILEDALIASFSRHRDDFQSLGKRWEDEILKQRIVPLIKEEVVPSIREHAEPVAKEIGRELWNRASLWRFGWRAVYDRSPLPERDLTKNEWERFIKEEAIPVFERHLDEILESQKRILVDLSKNQRIRHELESVLKEIAADEEFRTLFKAVVREAILENEALQAVWTRNFQSDQAKAAIRIASKRFEPVVRRIGDDLFGTRESGIDPDFARVLRNQILGKDRRWVTARPIASAKSSDRSKAVPRPPRSAAAPLVIRPAAERTEFPLLMMANEDV